MSHFSEDLLNADPDSLVRLREVLHGPSLTAPALPSLAARFGAGPDAVPPTDGASAGGDAKRRARSDAKSSRKGPRPSKGSGLDRAGSSKVSRKTLVSP